MCPEIQTREPPASWRVKVTPGRRTPPGERVYKVRHKEGQGQVLALESAFGRQIEEDSAKEMICPREELGEGCHQGPGGDRTPAGG